MSEVVRGAGEDAETKAAGTPPAAPPTADFPTLAAIQLPPPGERPSVPGYEVVEEVGRGGMGVVYKARQVGLNRFVALKMILAGPHAGPEQLARFRREGEAVARLAHPGIVQVYDVGSHEGRPYLALEYVGGGTLAQRTAGRPLPARAAAQLVESLARAVHYAHTRGVVHRDLKPGNILLQRTEDRGQRTEVRSQKSGGGEERAGGAAGSADLCPLSSVLCPKITDFGLAKMLDPEPGAGPAAQTQSGSILGTPAYMAPEQAGGKRLEVGPATDVHALGAILYELLTGRPPFLADSPVDTILKVVTEEPAPPRRLNPSVPRDLEAVCLHCLQKDPTRRYASALELAEDLRRFLAGEPAGPPRPGVAARLRRWARRRKWWLVGGAAGAFLLVVLMVSLALNALAFVVAGRVEKGTSGPDVVASVGVPVRPAPPPSLPEDLALVPRDALGFVRVRVAELWGLRGVDGWKELAKRGGPGELWPAALGEKLGLRPGVVERLTVVSLGAERPQDSFVLILALNGPYPADRLRARLTRRGLRARQSLGKTYYGTGGAGGEAFYAGGDTVLVYAPREEALKEWLALVPAADSAGRLRPALDLAAGRHHVVAGFAPPHDLRGALLERAQLALRKMALPGQEVPDLTPLGEARSATLALDVRSRPGGDAPEGLALEARVEFTDPPAARRGREALDGVREYLADVARLAAASSPEGFPRMVTGELRRALRTGRAEQRGPEVRLTFEPEWEPGWYKDAVRSAQEAARRTLSLNNLKQLALGMLQYHDRHGHFPPAAITDRKGRPLLSWRVAILPYVEQEALYKQFKLDEPWDGPHNKRLLARMPAVFAPPGPPAGWKPGTTFYQVFTGPQTLFPPGRKMRITDVKDGASNTLLVVEAGEAVPWTKPEDLPYDPTRPLPMLGGIFHEGFQAVFADGSSVRFLPRKIEPDTLRALITPAGGEPVRLP